jgi:hypothetical protein
MINPYGIPQPDFSGVQPLAPQQPPINIAVPKVNRGGMFANADWGSAISAALNGYLAAGGNPAGIAGLQQLHQQKMLEQRQAQEQQQYARERQDKRDDFTFEQDYKAAHPGPINNDTVNDYQFILQQLGPEAATTFLKTKTNPIVMTPYGPMPYSSVAAPQAPTKPVGPLTPIDDGGPTPTASGGFPGPY